jgi:predicted PurR-regulated permease PerM
MAVVVVWVLLTRATDTVVLLFVAITFGEGIRPIVDWLDAHRVPRALAVLSVYLLITIAIFGTLLLLLTPLTQQLIDFIENFPHYLERVQNIFSQLRALLASTSLGDQLLTSLPGELSGLGSGLASTVFTVPVMAADSMFKFVELYLMAFFWLTAATQLKSFVVGLFPPELHSEAADVIAEFGLRLGGHVRAVAINMVVIALLSGAGLFLLGVPYPLLLAFVAGLAETLPLIGPWIAGAIAVLVTVLTAGLIPAGEVAGLYLLIHLIEGNTLVPYVTYRLTELNPLATVVAISAGGGILGFVGAVLGVPVALVVQVTILRIVVPLLRHAAGVASREDFRRVS